MTISKLIKAHLASASWIRKLFEEGQQMRMDGGGPVYDFSIGNPDLEPPRKFIDALRRYACDETHGRHKYMANPGYPETRAAVARSLESCYGLPFRSEHVVMTVGAGGALNVALKTLLDPGDEVIVSRPFFVEYGFYIENHGGQMVTVPTRKNFDIDPDAIAEAISRKTRVVLINNPNNPTGVVYPQATLDRLGEMLRRASAGRDRAIVLIDDAPYRKLVYDMDRCTSPFSAYEHTLMGTSHSKDLGVPGERIGFLAVSPRCNDAPLVSAGAAFANRVLGFVNAPALMQRVVAEVQDELIDLDWYRRKRDRLVKELTKMGYKVPYPGGAFYVFPEAPGGDDIAFIEKLKKRRVLVVPGSGFGCRGYFRI
ncbi:MAG: pyridoxal phosphate-dependent aminotransferase, partial [Myxococcota bacterium]|nr:pyridoxal phosphate-dependent aminotransferase [Myxococcota bacterium]